MLGAMKQIISLLTVLAVLSPLLVHAHDDHDLEKRAKSSAVKALFAHSPKTYPTPDVTATKPRSAWINAYKKAKAAGKIPNIPPTTLVNYIPTYPSGYTGNPCNFYTQKCTRKSDIITSPAGIVGLSFDDGPFPVSTSLLSYLKAKKLHATHFTIGSRIFYNQQVLKDMFAAGEHIAAHTWSHPSMTTLTDMEVLAEVGWGMQIIYDITGKIPKYFRCPYGDCDDRIRAILIEVFHVINVGWTEDPRDWCLSDAAGSGSACGVGDGPQTLPQLENELLSYVKKNKKSKGLIILEHENGWRPIAAFKTLYKALVKKGWKAKAIPEMFSPPLAWYA